MKLSDFDYVLPKELIAQYPRDVRDEARLLVVDRACGRINHAVFSSLGDYLSKSELVVLNDTRVLPARLLGQRATGGKVEALLLRQITGASFEALLKPARLKLNERIGFDGGKIFGVVTGKNQISFEASGAGEVFAHGRMPLPPYIKREATEIDLNYYQTVYAAKDGAVASPTAGLHFTHGLIDKLKGQGIVFVNVTLHVGIGTFKPLKCADITEHKMSSEYFQVPEATKEAIVRAKEGKRRVIAVGTTSLRALEAEAAGCRDSTDLYVYPGYKFRTVDCLLTNFHLPRTTLFVLACAFGGTELIKKAYAEAIEKKYRFYSYGDAMLIL